MNWRCTTCSEQHDDAFDTCWNCGCDREGNREKPFERATDRPKRESLVDAIVDHAETMASLLPRTPEDKALSEILRAQNVRFKALEDEVANLRAEVRALGHQRSR